MPTRSGVKYRNQDLKDSDIGAVDLIYLKTPVGDTLCLTDGKGNQTFIYLSEFDVEYLNRRTSR